MAPTVYVSDVASNPSRSHLYPDTLDDLLESGPLVRRRPHHPPRDNKERRTRGSVWLQSPRMGLTADDLRHQATSRGEEKANFSTNSNSDNTEYRSEDSMDCKSPSRRHEKWSREEILKHQQQQCQRILLLRRRESLLDITVRTVNLIRRNQQLQHRLAALQAETRAFVRSVLNNPENQAIRELTLRSRRKSRSEDESEDNGCKRVKLEASTTRTTTTTTTVTITTTTTTATTTTTSAARVEKDQTFSKHNNNEK